MLEYNQIQQLLVELLNKHNCVIVPNFGGFVARENNSQFNNGDNLLYPPSKHVLFNKNLIHSDGLLVGELMRQNNILFEDATKHIEDFRNYLQSVLFAKKRFELPQIGLLYIDAEHVIRFEANNTTNFLLDAFGFEPVIANKLIHEAERPIISPIFEDRVIAHADKPAKRKRNYTRIATAIIVIPTALTFLLFAATSKPVKPLLESSFNPFYSPNKLYQPIHNTHDLFFLDKTNADPLLMDANGYATFKLSHHGSVLVATTNPIEKDKTSVANSHRSQKSISSFQGAFQVVVGCFSVEGNAKKLISDLSKNNINAGISGINAKGLHVVSCGGFDTKEAATELLSTIKQEFPNAWIMAK